METPKFSFTNFHRAFLNQCSSIFFLKSLGYTNTKGSGSKRSWSHSKNGIYDPILILINFRDLKWSKLIEIMKRLPICKVLGFVNAVGPVYSYIEYFQGLVNIWVPNNLPIHFRLAENTLHSPPFSCWATQCWSGGDFLSADVYITESHATTTTIE